MAPSNTDKYFIKKKKKKKKKNVLNLNTVFVILISFTQFRDIQDAPEALDLEAGQVHGDVQLYLQDAPETLHPEAERVPGKPDTRMLTFSIGVQGNHQLSTAKDSIIFGNIIT